MEPFQAGTAAGVDAVVADFIHTRQPTP